MCLHSAWNVERAGEIIAIWRDAEGGTLPALQALLAEFGAIPEAAIPLLADAFNLSRAEIHGLVSFYHDFRTTPPGGHLLKLCRAEACQSMHGASLAENLLARLGIKWGETTADGALTVEPAYCLGLCATAPAALLDGMPQGRLDAARLDRLVAATQ